MGVIACLALAIAGLTVAAPSAWAADSTAHEHTWGTDILNAARSQGGRPYVWGGGSASGPTGGGYDCVGLAIYAYARAGLDINAYPGDSSHFVPTARDAAIKRYGASETTSASKAQVGDLVFFYEPGADPRTPYHHVGIYAGGGQMVDAYDTGTVVRTEPVSDAGGRVTYVHIPKLSTYHVTSAGGICTGTTQGMVCLRLTLVNAEEHKWYITATFTPFYGRSLYASYLYLGACSNSDVSTCDMTAYSSLSVPIQKSTSVYYGTGKDITAGYRWVSAHVTFGDTSSSTRYRFSTPPKMLPPV